MAEVGLRLGIETQHGAARFPINDPLTQALGLVRWAAPDKSVEMSIEPGIVALNTGGALHGGSISTWLDMAMYEAARRRLGPCATISLDMQFLCAGRKAPLTTTARISRSVGGMAFCAAEITQENRIIAAGIAIYQKIRSQIRPAISRQEWRQSGGEET